MKRPKTPKLAALPRLFTYTQARGAGLSKRELYRLRDEGGVDVQARGLYRKRGAETADSDLLELALRAPEATLCLATALARHELVDTIPAELDVAIPRGTRCRATSLAVAWHRFDPKTFDVGRTELRLPGAARLAIYSPERSIVDAFRMRGTEGRELGREALKRWLRRRGSQPAALLAVARQFPRAERALREALELLL